MGRAARSVAALVVALLTNLAGSESLAKDPDSHTPVPWSVPDVGALPDNDYGRLVRFGRTLLTATYAHIGPNAADPGKRYAGNNLACSNCHLDAGTKRFGLPLWGLANEYPQYSHQEGREITIVDRVNLCITRSMNGRTIPKDAPEIRAMVAYLDFLSTGIAPGQRLSGHGSGPISTLDRPADPKRGGAIYEKNCAVCHGTNGEGIRNGLPTMALGYLVPPLWGPDSFNTAAGMAHLTNAAPFIYSNMPNGTSYVAPRLSADEAWDVGAFIVSQPRPKKAAVDGRF